MPAEDKVLNKIHETAKKKILFLPHAVRQMSRPDRMITVNEVRQVIETGEVIEDYPDDARGHSSLLLGFGENSRPIHVVCAPKDKYLSIITAYLPNMIEWSKDYKRRK